MPTMKFPRSRSLLLALFLVSLLSTTWGLETQGEERMESYVGGELEDSQVPSKFETLASYQPRTYRRLPPAMEAEGPTRFTWPPVPFTWPWNSNSKYSPSFSAGMKMLAEGSPILAFLIVATIIGFVAQNFLTGEPLNFFRFAVWFPPTIKRFEVWRLWTHVFLHSDIGHLLSNMLCILLALDLEWGFHMPGHPPIGMGSQGVAMLLAVSIPIAALTGTVFAFHAMVEGISAGAFALDGAVLASCSLLLGAKDHGADRWIKGDVAPLLYGRMGYVAVHLVFELMRACRGGQGTIGTLAHLVGFSSGFWMVVANPTPSMLFPCAAKSANLCVDIPIYFTGKHLVRTAEACQIVGIGILFAMGLVGLLNAFLCKKHVSPFEGDIAYQCCTDVREVENNLAGAWHCPKCTLVNPPSRNTCSACQTPRPSKEYGAV